MKTIFVFGSNLAGRHGKGAALFARKNYGAVYGVANGPTGQAYAIPTKDERFAALPIDKISEYVSDFCLYARSYPDINFQLTPVGTGLAGIPKRTMVKLFHQHKIPSNVFLTSTWIYEESA